MSNHTAIADAERIVLEAMGWQRVRYHSASGKYVWRLHGRSVLGLPTDYVTTDALLDLCRERRWVSEFCGKRVNVYISPHTWVGSAPLSDNHRTALLLAVAEALKGDDDAQTD